jgi:uncharacterized phage protein (TIGR01671 family)
MTNHRPFKFRIWNRIFKRFIKQDSIAISACGNLFVGEGWRNDFQKEWNSFKSNDLIIQQFTGLTDKTGREIYEGDILKFLLEFAFDGGYPSFQEVKWSDKNGRWILPMVTIDYFNPSYVEVVGNIFENPELLKPCSKN